MLRGSSYREEIPEGTKKLFELREIRVMEVRVIDSFFFMRIY